MGGCSAINCTNSHKKGSRMFRFPTDPIRKKRWIINCRRDNWSGHNAQLCQDHFEESQFELGRADKWKKLKQTAIPTLFDIPNTPKQLTFQKLKEAEMPKPYPWMKQVADTMALEKEGRIRIIIPDQGSDTVFEKDERIKIIIPDQVRNIVPSVMPHFLNQDTDVENDLENEKQIRIIIPDQGNRIAPSLIPPPSNQSTNVTVQNATPDVKALLERIAWLEKENTLLREENQKAQALLFLFKQQEIMSRKGQHYQAEYLAT